MKESNEKRDLGNLPERLQDWEPRQHAPALVPRPKLPPGLVVDRGPHQQPQSPGRKEVALLG